MKVGLIQELYDKKKKELEILEYQALNSIIDICYFDESGFNLTPNFPYAWTTIGKTISISAKMSKNLNVLGFLNLNKQKLFASCTYNTVDSDVVIEHFNLFANEITKETVYG